MRPDRRDDEDRAWLPRLKAGETAAWEWLCDTYGDALFLYAYHRNGRDRVSAEDVRQETLLAAAEGIASFRGEVPLFGWLCAIARRKLADEARRGARVTPLEATADSLPSREPEPAQAAERGSRDAAVVEALMSLPEPQRDALVARYVREEGVEAVASQLGRSYKATESLLSRAREGLRARMREVWRDGS